MAPGSTNREEEESSCAAVGSVYRRGVFFLDWTMGDSVFCVLFVLDFLLTVFHTHASG
jgi:hypothetical protein